MEPHGQSPWYLDKIPSSAPGRCSASAFAKPASAGVGRSVRKRQGFCLSKNLFGEQVGGLSADGEIHRSVNPSVHEGFSHTLHIHPQAEPVVFCVAG